MFLTVNEKKIYYEVHGEGQAIIILNGIMMSTASWHGYLNDFNDYQLILVDFFNQGQSDTLAIDDHARQVQVVRDLVNHLNLKDIYLFGISYGGQIALQYAIEYPVKKLAVFNCALYTTPWLKDIGDAWVLSAYKNDPELFFHVTIPYIYSHLFYNENYDWVSERKGVLLKIFNEAFLNRMITLIKSSETYDVREKASEITCPTLVVGAEFDYLTPMDETKKISKEIESSHFIPIMACGHASMYEKPKLFVKYLRDFFMN